MITPFVCIGGALVYIIASMADSDSRIAPVLAEIGKWMFIVGLAVYLFKG